MKKFFASPVLLFSAFLPLLFSCSTDSYEKGEGDYSLMRAEMADITVDGNKLAVSAVTDEGETLTFSTPFTTSWFVTADSVYRTILYYNKEENGKAEAIGTSRVNVLQPHVISDIKTDPVRFESAWISTNRRYINAGIYVMVGDLENELLTQVIGVNVDTLLQHDNGKSTLRLTLYHDQGGMPEYFSQRTYLSIPLDSLNVDTVSLGIHTYDSVVVKRFPLH